MQSENAKFKMPSLKWKVQGNAKYRKMPIEKCCLKNGNFKIASKKGQMENAKCQ